MANFWGKVSTISLANGNALEGIDEMPNMLQRRSLRAQPRLTAKALDQEGWRLLTGKSGRKSFTSTPRVSPTEDVPPSKKRKVQDDKDSSSGQLANDDTGSKILAMLMEEPQHRRITPNAMKVKDQLAGHDERRETPEIPESPQAKQTPKRKSIAEKLMASMHDYPEYGDAKELALWLVWKINDAIRLQNESKVTIQQQSPSSISSPTTIKVNRHLRPDLLRKLVMNVHQHPLFSAAFSTIHLLGSTGDAATIKLICGALSAFGTSNMNSKIQQNADWLLQYLEQDRLVPIAEAIEALSTHEFVQRDISSLLQKIEGENMEKRVVSTPMPQKIEGGNIEKRVVSAPMSTSGLTKRRATTTPPAQPRAKSARPSDHSMSISKDLEHNTEVNEQKTKKRKSVSKTKEGLEDNVDLDEHKNKKQKSGSETKEHSSAKKAPLSNSHDYNQKTHNKRHKESPVSRHGPLATSRADHRPDGKRIDSYIDQFHEDQDMSFGGALSQQSSSSSDTIMVASHIDQMPQVAKIPSNSPTLTSTSTMAVPSSVTSFDSLPRKPSGTPPKRRDSLEDIVGETKKEDVTIEQIPIPNKATPAQESTPDEGRGVRSSKRARKPTGRLLEAVDADPSLKAITIQDPPKVVKKEVESVSPKRSLIVKLKVKVPEHSNEYLALAPEEQSLVDRLLELCNQAALEEDDDDGEMALDY